MLSGHNSRENRAANTLRYRWKLLPKERGIPACLSYIVKGDRIRLPGNPAGVKFDFPIGDLVETEDAIVMCLALPEGRTCSENIYAINHSGNLRWRVVPQPFQSRHAPYVSVRLQGSVISLHTRDGKTYRINARDGSPVTTDLGAPENKGCSH